MQALFGHCPNSDCTMCKHRACFFEHNAWNVVQISEIGLIWKQQQKQLRDSALGGHSSLSVTCWNAIPLGGRSALSGEIESPGTSLTIYYHITITITTRRHEFVCPNFQKYIVQYSSLTSRSVLPRLLVGTPWGLLDFALWALRPCDPRNNALDIELKNFLSSFTFWAPSASWPTIWAQTICSDLCPPSHSSLSHSKTLNPFYLKLISFKPSKTCECCHS